jgi:hypothetical protein
VRWVVDGNNVMGSRPDGWWNDRAGAATRLTDAIAAWCRSHDDHVVVVFDGRPVADVVARAGGNLEVRFAPRPGRDAADDHIVDLLDDLLDERNVGGGAEPDVEGCLDGSVEGGLVVVTADRGLVARLPSGVRVEGPRAFLRRLGEDVTPPRAPPRALPRGARSPRRGSPGSSPPGSRRSGA